MAISKPVLAGLALGALWACLAVAIQDDDEGKPKPPPPPPAAAIQIVEVLGGRKLALGDFTQETDPDRPMRLFIDTQETWDGGVVPAATYDKQRVKITARVTPDALDPADFEVRWELRDPDDPADHPDIDGRGGAHDPRGGDDTGIPHEGDQHWFSRADHEIGAQVDRDADDETTVIGEAVTQVTKADGVNLTTTFLNFGDDGGDDYVVTVVLLRKRGAGEETPPSDRTATLTAWRKYEVKKYAVVRAINGNELDPLPDAAATDAFRTGWASTMTGAEAANANTYIDFGIERATGRARVGAAQETYRLSTGGTVEVRVDGGVAVRRAYTVANAGAATAAETEATFTGANAVAGLETLVGDALRRVLLETATQVQIDNPRGLNNNYGYRVVECWSNKLPDDRNRRWTAYRTVDWSTIQPADETSIYALYYTSYHTGVIPTGHPDYTLQLMGWNRNRSTSKLGGTVAPHSHVAHDRHEVGGVAAGADLAATAVHEIGHSLYTIGSDGGGHDDDANTVDYHDRHSDGAAACAADGTVEDVRSAGRRFCPRHVKNLRLRVFRAWPGEGQGRAGE